MEKRDRETLGERKRYKLKKYLLSFIDKKCFLIIYKINSTDL